MTSFLDSAIGRDGGAAARGGAAGRNRGSGSCDGIAARRRPREHARRRVARGARRSRIGCHPRPGCARTLSLRCVAGPRGVTGFAAALAARAQRTPDAPALRLAGEGRLLRRARRTCGERSAAAALARRAAGRSRCGADGERARLRRAAARRDRVRGRAAPAEHAARAARGRAAAARRRAALAVARGGARAIGACGVRGVRARRAREVAERFADPRATANGPSEPACSGDRLVALLYTSGTTGRPKGVMLTESNLRASAEASRRHLGVREGDRWLACLPLFHVGGLSLLLRSVIDGQLRRAPRTLRRRGGRCGDRRRRGRFRFAGPDRARPAAARARRARRSGVAAVRSCSAVRRRPPSWWRAPSASASRSRRRTGSPRRRRRWRRAGRTRSARV